MPKGHIDTRTYKANLDTDIKMDGWLSATIYNTGTSDVVVMGITVKPGDSFVLGNATVKLYTSIDLKWSSQDGELVVHYIQLINC